MSTLVETLGLNANPFERYVAEMEPDIAEYAVKPPYFETISARAARANSFILFGDRGAGKSATRITVFKEMWGRKAAGEEVPLAVNFIDFSPLVHGAKLTGIDESALVSEIAYITLEQILIWLSSLSDDDRNIYTEALDDDEKDLIVSLLSEFYLSRPESRRTVSAQEAMNLLNQAWSAKAKLWIEKKWGPITNVISKIAEGFFNKYAGEGDVSESLGALMKRERSEYTARSILQKLVQLSNVFGFSGICVLIDKLDETPATNNSAEATAELIYPVLAHVQLLEVAGCALTFFLWSSVKSFFEQDRLGIRLDKIGHATAQWDDGFFLAMLDKRMKFYSSEKHDFASLFDKSVDTKAAAGQLIDLSMRSPRELIRLMDVILREHDVLHASKEVMPLIDARSLEVGQDIYVKDVIQSVYGEKSLGQIYRLSRERFTNKEVQSTFRINDQSARQRIKGWEDAGIVKQTGTRAAEGGQGGKPANEYSVVDARVVRVINRQLVTYDPEDSAME